MTLPWNDRFAGAEVWGENDQPVMSGPVVVGVADTAMYGRCLAITGPDCLPVIAIITTTFLAPVAPRGIDAVATMIRSGRRLSYLRCEPANDGDTTPRAFSLATYAVRPANTLFVSEREPVGAAGL